MSIGTEFGGSGLGERGDQCPVLILRINYVAYHRVPTQIAFSNSLFFPCPMANFPCANLRDL